MQELELELAGFDVCFPISLLGIWNQCSGENTDEHEIDFSIFSVPEIVEALLNYANYSI